MATVLHWHLTKASLTHWCLDVNDPWASIWPSCYFINVAIWRIYHKIEIMMRISRWESNWAQHEVTVNLLNWVLIINLLTLHNSIIRSQFPQSIWNAIIQSFSKVKIISTGELFSWQWEDVLDKVINHKSTAPTLLCELGPTSYKLHHFFPYHWYFCFIFGTHFIWQNISKWNFLRVMHRCSGGSGIQW